MKNALMYGLAAVAIILVATVAYPRLFAHQGETTLQVTDESAETLLIQDASTAAAETDTPDAAQDTATELPPANDEPLSEDTAEDQGSLLAPPSGSILDVPAMMEDRILGNPAAPVTIVEYASLTCAHCAQFATAVLPEVKARLIDSGRVKLIAREFPLDQLALRAAMLARCVPADRYYDFLDVLFRNQERWVRAEEPLRALKQLGSLTGLEEERMDACMTSAEMETAILSRVTEAQTRHNIRATPTFIFNNGAEIFTGAQTPEKFEEVVDSLTR